MSLIGRIKQGRKLARTPGESKRFARFGATLNLSEESLHFVHSAHESLDVSFVVVKCEGGAGGCRNFVVVHQRLGAVVTDPNSNALGVENRADVLGVGNVIKERNDGRFARGFTEDADTAQ